MNVVGSTHGSLGIRDGIVKRLAQRLNGNTCPRSAGIPRDADVIIGWRMRNLPGADKFIKRGGVIVYLDLGYFDETHYETFSISLNGVHGQSFKVRGLENMPERPKPELQPWKKGGSIVQVMAPGHPTDICKAQQVGGRAPQEWARNVAQEAEILGKKVQIRYHPRKLPPFIESVPPFEETFEEMYLAVTYSSTAATNTVVAGIPTVAYHKRSPAWDVCAQGTLERVTPDRAEWIHMLSYRQYDMLNPAELAVAADYITEGVAQIRGGRK